MEIRPIRKEDNKAIASVIREVLEEHQMAKEGTVYTDPTTDTLYQLFRTTKSRYWVVVDQEEIVGGCGIYPTKGLPEDCAELVKLYVHSKARGHGLGKELIELCAALAFEMGYRRLYLESIPELSNAVGLYESTGFRKIDAPLGDSGHFACDLWMIKELD